MPEPVVADLAAHFAARGDGVQWSLPAPSDLNANLVHLDAGSAVQDHVNSHVDVLFVVVAGTGTLRVDGHDLPLEPFTVVHVAKGSARAIVAAEHGLSYVTVHRDRGPLQVKARPATPA
jgi:quercetin dioxygenase-like cupin family protein